MPGNTYTGCNLAGGLWSVTREHLDRDVLGQQVLDRLGGIWAHFLGEPQFSNRREHRGEDGGLDRLRGAGEEENPLVKPLD